ncbi:MAG: archaellin/type IV pilin N-terminal domain-containing protein [Candidatus Pacearchaeota archaeon]
MIKKNKRAISPVIATLLLVVITIIATLTLGKFVKEIINKDIGKSSCYEYMDYINILDSEYTCSNSTSTLIQIERGSDQKEIDGIYISLSSGASSKGYELKNGTNLNGVKMYDGSSTIVLPERGEALTYIFSLGNVSYSTITVMINGKTCDITSQSYNIKKCT